MEDDPVRIFPYVVEIAEIINRFKSKNILVYNCGNGMDYIRERCHVAWGVERPYLYDPNVEQFKRRPNGKYDGVVCIEPATDEQLKEIGTLANQWVFLANNEAKHFPPELTVVVR